MRLVEPSDIAEPECMSPREIVSASPLCVFAHPDDEILAMGGVLQTMPPADIFVVTDGAPPWIEDPVAHAAMRRAESRAALALCDIPHRLHFLGFSDQCVAASAREVIASLIPFVKRAGTLYTHALEHGHPDHDAVCLAVHIAAQIVQRHDAVMECPLYANKAGELTFTPQTESSVRLPDDVFRLKEKMLERFESQQDFLKRFPCAYETFQRVCLRFSVSLETLLADFPHDIPSAASAEDWRHLGALLEASAP